MKLSVPVRREGDMEFTPDELKLIERLRKQERQWPRARWALLAGSVLIFIFYSYIVVRLVRMVESESVGEGATLFFAFLWPKCLLMFCFATYAIILAIWDWRGNANRRLLLKLLDAQLNQTSKDSKPVCGSRA